YLATDILAGSYFAALSRKRSRQEPALPGHLVPTGGEFDVRPGTDITHDVTFVARRLVLRLRNADGSMPAHGPCWLRWGQQVESATLGNGELVLDPAPELAVQVAAESDGPWSEPVSMPTDRLVHAVTVVVPAAR